MDLEKIKQLAAANPQLKGSVLDRLAAIGEVKEAQADAVPEERDTVNKSGLGVSIPVKIMKVEQKTGASGRPYTDYDLLIPRGFGALEVAPNEGELVNENNIKLRVHSSRKMTTAEIQLHKERCEAEGITDRWEKNREKDNGYMPPDVVETLTPGMILKVRSFTAAFRKSKDLAFEAGDSVFVQNLYAEQELDTEEVKDENNHVIERKIFPNQYGVKWYAKGMRADRTAEMMSDAEIWQGLKQHNQMPNLRPEAGYGSHNQTEEEKKFEEGLGARNNQLDRWKVVNSKVPHATRGFVKAPFVASLYRPDDGPTPAQLVNENALVVANPRWHTKWSAETGDKDNMEVFKVATFELDAQIFESGQVSAKARVLASIAPTAAQRKEGQEMLNQFGCVNVQRFAKIAPVYVPLCSGTVVLKLDLVGTAYMVENNPEMNPKDAHGNFVEGVEFGCSYNAQVLEPDVASGVVRAGFRISREAAEKVFRKAFGVAPTRDHPPKLVMSYAERNTLNRKLNSPVKNTFESPENFTSLENEGWWFYFVCAKSKNDTKVQKFFDKMRQVTGGDEQKMLQLVSALVTDECDDDAFLGFPASVDADPYAYCVFAVKANVAAELEKPFVPRDEDDFLSEVLALLEKKQQQSKKRGADTQTEEPEAKRHVVDAAPEPHQGNPGALPVQEEEEDQMDNSDDDFDPLMGLAED